MRLCLLLSIIGLVFISCDDDNVLDQDQQFLIYHQTYCSDPWGYSNDDDELVAIIKSYFKSEDIEINSVKIDLEGTQQLCNACICLSGKRILVNVNQSDGEVMKEYGFQKYD